MQADISARMCHHGRMVTKPILAGKQYVLSAPDACTASQTAPNGTSVVVASIPAGGGQISFVSIATNITFSQDSAVLTGPFDKAPTLGGNGGGGYIESNLHIGHGASAAVAAQCTLTLGNLATGGTLEDSNGHHVELEDPHKYAEGGAAFRDAAEACTLTIGEWSKAWEAAPATRAAGWLQLAAGAGTFMVNGGIVNNPEDYTDVEAWNDVLEHCGVFCTDESIESGSPKINIAAIVPGTEGNAITLEAVGKFFSVSGPTLAGGKDARTTRDVYNDILEDEDCPVDVTLDADEQGLGFTAKEYGVNDAISAEGDMFSNWSGMSGGHGDYTVAELVTAIAGEFEDITPTEGEVEGTITLTANEAGADANSITYTATGCFGSGTVKQGSTTRGKNAVTQTAFKIYLNGEEFTGGSVTIDPAPTQGSTNAVSSGGVFVHTNDSARHVNAADKTGWNAAILCHEYLNTLPVGNSNFYAHYIILNEKQVPRGFLKGVSLHCRNAGTAQPSPFYLGVFEQQEGGSSDPATWSFLGISTAAVQEVIGETREWSFDGIELAGGRTVALCSMLTPDEGWNTGAQFGLRVSERPEDDTISRVDNGAFIPQMTLSVMVMSGELVVALKKSLNELTERVTALEETAN